MLENEITKVNLRKMVINFYTKILKDETVGPFFIERLGDDLMNPTWGEHIDLLTNFWAAFFTGDMDYRGSPFAPHASMAGLKADTFQQWLKLFFETADKIYEPQLADQLKERGTLIAGNFMRNLRL